MEKRLIRLFKEDQPVKGECATLFPTDTSPLPRKSGSPKTVLKAVPKSTKKAAPPVAKKKAGRPELWTVEKLSNADRQSAIDLRVKYGPDTESAAAFQKKYEDFCTLNNLEPGEAMFLAMGQASKFGQELPGGKKGLAFSSMETQFGTLLKRRVWPCADSWAAKRTLQSAHADADPVQPRTYEGSASDIQALVENMKPIEKKAMGYLQFSTGTRSITVSRCRNSQVLIERSDVIIQRRLSKVCKSRSKRDTLTYKMSWSMPCPDDVKAWLLKKRTEKPDELIFGHVKSLQAEKASTTITTELRRVCSDKSITSYAFRDFMDAKLEEEELGEAEFERLMEHTVTTSRASYKKTPISRALAKRVADAKAIVKASKKKPITKKKSITKKK